MSVDSFVNEKKLWRKVNGICLKNSCKLLILQLVTVENIDDIPHFVWVTLSSSNQSSQSFYNAMSTFTLYKDQNGSIKRTLLFDDLDDCPYWYRDWETPFYDHCDLNGDEILVDHKKSKYDNILKSDKSIETSDLRKLTEKKLENWLDCLKVNYGGKCSTMWVTQKHSLPKGESFVSSGFCVFSNFVSDEKARYSISKRIKEYIIDYLLETYSRIINERQIIYSNNFTKFLSTYKNELHMPSEVEDQIFKMLPVIQARLPMVVEGPTGTGKLTIAKHIANISKESSINAGWIDLKYKNIEPFIINCRYSQENGKVLNDLICLKKYLNGESGKIHCNDIHIVIDNAHYLNINSQVCLLEILEKRLSYFDHNNLEKIHFIITYAPNLDLLFFEAKILPELYELLGGFRIILPSIMERLINAGDYNSKFLLMKQLISIIGEDLQELFAGYKYDDQSLNNLTNDEIINEFANKPWPGNYRQLRQELLRSCLMNYKINQ